MYDTIKIFKMRNNKKLCVDIIRTVEKRGYVGQIFYTIMVTPKSQIEWFILILKIHLN